MPAKFDWLIGLIDWFSWFEWVHPKMKTYTPFTHLQVALIQWASFFELKRKKETFIVGKYIYYNQHSSFYSEQPL